MIEFLDGALNVLWRLAGITVALVAWRGLSTWKERDTHRQILDSLKELRTAVGRLIDLGTDASASVEEVGMRSLASGSQRVTAIELQHLSSPLKDSLVKNEVEKGAIEFLSSLDSEFGRIRSHANQYMDAVFHHSSILEFTSDISKDDLKTIINGCRSIKDRLDALHRALVENFSLNDLVDAELRMYEQLHEICSTYFIGRSGPDGRAIDDGVKAMHMVWELMAQTYKSQRDGHSLWAMPSLRAKTSPPSESE